MSTEKRVNSSFVVEPGHTSNSGHPVARKATMQVRIEHLVLDTGEIGVRTMKGDVDADRPATAATLLESILHDVLHKQALRIIAISAKISLIDPVIPIKPAPPEGPALPN